MSYLFNRARVLAGSNRLKAVLALSLLALAAIAGGADFNSGP